jgi:hypothetical protein
MTQQAPPVWDQPSPGAPRGPRSPAQRYETLGTTCLALSIGELLYCLWRLLSPLVSRTMIEAQRRMLPSNAGGVPMAKITDAAQSFMAQIQVWEAVRTVPFLVATAFLLWIALRLRKAEEKALFAAKAWGLWALGAVVVSVLIQILITVPATIEYQRAVVDLIPTMPAGASTPFDVKKMTSSITIISTVMGLVIGTVAMAAWPIALYFWASKLIRETVNPPA